MTSPYLRLDENGNLVLDQSGLSNNATQILGGKENRLPQAQAVPENDRVGGEIMQPRQRGIQPLPPEEEARHRANLPEAPPPSGLSAPQPGVQRPSDWTGRLSNAGVNPDDVLARRQKRLEQRERERDEAVDSADTRGRWGALAGAFFNATDAQTQRRLGAGRDLAGRMDPRLAQERSSIEEGRAAQVSSDPNSPGARQAREVFRSALQQAGIDPASIPSIDQMSEAQLQEYLRSPLVRGAQRTNEIGLRNEGSAARTEAAQEGQTGRNDASIASREREGQLERELRLQIAQMRRGRGGAAGPGAAANAEQERQNVELLARRVLQERNQGVPNYDPATDPGDPGDPRSAVQEELAILGFSGTEMPARGIISRGGSTANRENMGLTNQQENQSRQNYLARNSNLITLRNALGPVEQSISRLQDRDLQIINGALAQTNGNLQQAMALLARDPNAGNAIGGFGNLVSLLGLARSGKAMSDRERQEIANSLGMRQFVSVGALREGIGRLRNAVEQDYRLANQAFRSVVDEQGNFLDEQGQAPQTQAPAAPDQAQVQALVGAAARRGRTITPEEAAQMIQRRRGQ